MLQDDLDIDTPLAKMIKFLKSYSTGVRVGYFSGPSKREAASLLQLIIRSGGNLTTPDIQHQIEEAPDVATDMARCVKLRPMIKGSLCPNPLCIHPSTQSHLGSGVRAGRSGARWGRGVGGAPSP